MLRRALACLFLLSLLLPPPAHARTPIELPPQPRIAGPDHAADRIEGAGTAGLAKAAGDTATLYGGPGTQEGKFETAGGVPDWQGWVGVDLTDTRDEQVWQVSTFNAETLGGHGAGNLAMWCGQSAAQQPGWALPPGYGNNWNSSLMWSSGPLNDPSVGQTVALDFYFLFQTEPGYDFLYVEYDSAGSWLRCLSADGWAVPPALGHAYADEKDREIVFAGHDYGGNGGDEIRIRIRFDSDGAWSDEDGLWDTDTGAAQVDDIAVAWQDGGLQSSFEDFEGGGPYAWTLQEPPFVGDFAKLFVGLRDDDPCAGNPSAQVTFIDDGTPPSNGDGQTTGGSTSAEYGYAVTGGYVVNHTGGLSDGMLNLKNEVWSPPIAWDLAGSADDALDGGAALLFDVYNHLPVANEIFYLWWVRASEDGGATWLDWQNHGFFNHGGTDGYYDRANFQIRHLLPAHPTHVQIALGVWEVLLGYGGSDATPSPWFDNVKLIRYRAGPRLATRGPFLFQSSFPPSGLANPFADPAALACRLDAAHDLASRFTNPEAPIVPGDSCVVEAKLLVEGRTLQRLELKWQLDVNPLFAAERSMPPNTVVQPGAGVHGWDRWLGTLAGQACTTSLGAPVDDQFFFDFEYEGGAAWPHQNESELAMFFPGDRLRYYVEAEDDLGLVSTLPGDVSGFADGTDYDQRFEVHALPSIHQDGDVITQPSLLFVDAAGRSSFGPFGRSSGYEPPFGAPDEDGLYAHLFGQLGLVEGVDYDRFTLLNPLDGSCGIGSAYAWGATVEQIAGYGTLLFEGGTGLSLLHDGSRSDTKSEDLALIAGWHALPGPRSLGLFGDALITFTDQRDNGAFTTIREDILGLERLTYFLKYYIDEQNAPQALPLIPGFDTEYSVVLGCRVDVDALQPLSGAIATHGYEMAGSPGVTYPTPVASIAYADFVGGDVKKAITFPYALSRVWDERSEIGDDRSRIALLGEVLDYLIPGWAPSGTPTATGTPSRAGIHALNAAPNPFNPKTVLRFEVGRAAEYAVRIFDLRGRLVRVVHQGPLAAGAQALAWDGADDRGRSVASGVYLLRVEGDGQVAGAKLALVR